MLRRASHVIYILIVSMAFSAFNYADVNTSFSCTVLFTMNPIFCFNRWSAYVVDGNVKALNVEKVPSEFKVSGGDVILDQI